MIQLLNDEAGDVTAVDEIRISPGKLAAVSNSIVTLWKDEGFRQCFRRSKEYQLIDSAKYYLDKAAEICDPSFHPTDQDILRYLQLFFLSNFFSSLSFFTTKFSIELKSDIAISVL